MKYYAVLECKRCGEIIVNEVSNYEEIISIKDNNNFIHVCEEDYVIIKQGFCRVIGFDITTQGE